MGILSRSDLDKINKSEDFSLDELLANKLVCKGFVGTKFTIKRTGFYNLLDNGGINVEITPTSKQFKEDNTDILYEVVTLPFGIYTCDVVYKTFKKTLNITFSQAVGIIGYTIYNIDEILFEKDIPGEYSFVIPEGTNQIILTASGGGGGGKYGDGSRSYDVGGIGGYGGTAGTAVKDSIKDVTSGVTIPITVGAGGSGGTVDVPAGNGTPTVVGSIVTLAGGSGGGGVSGGKGGSGGGSNGLPAKGLDGTQGNGSSSGAGGTPGKGGIGGSPYVDIDYNNYGYPGGGGGGGGGANIGTGGNGGDGGGDGRAIKGSDGSPGTKGGGGGGGGGQSGKGSNGTFLTSSGGKGGDGYVLIIKRTAI